MHVIVTGGSSGIGLAVANRFAKRGAHLTLIARDRGRLEAAQHEITQRHPALAVEIAAVDIADDGQLFAAIQSSEAKLGPCDILIASAGIVEPGRFAEQTAASFDRQIATNLTGTANSIRAVIQGMEARRTGRILIVSSGAGLLGIYGYAAYCASKSALTGLAEALRCEYAGRGIAITLAFPPDTRTPQLEKELESRPPEAELLMGKVAAQNADQIALAMERALDRGRKQVYFTPLLMVLALLGPLVKPFVYAWFQHRLRQHRRRPTPDGA